MFLLIGASYLFMLPEPFGIARHNQQRLIDQAAQLRAIAADESLDEQEKRTQVQDLQGVIDVTISVVSSHESQARLFIGIIVTSWAIAALCFFIARNKAGAARSTQGNGAEL